MLIPGAAASEGPSKLFRNLYQEGLSKHVVLGSADGLGVAKGTGMGHFSPASTVSRGAMAAFITRALAHTTARPAGVTIRSSGPGKVIISVRDANFQPAANAAVDIFSAAADKVDEAFNEDGSCNKPRFKDEGSSDEKCEIDALDVVTGLSGDFATEVTVNVKAGGTTVWAWTGKSGDEVEDGGEGIASINLTEASPMTAAAAKVTNDLGMGVTRAHFGSTVTVTIQLVGNATTNRADAVPDDGGNSYTVTILRDSDTDERTDDHTAAVTVVDDADAASKTTQVLKVDASGKATFEITASDPDPDDRNNPNGADASGDNPAVPDRIDRVRVTYTVAALTGGQAVAADADVSGSAATETITFSDARAVMAGASVKPTAAFLTRPLSGSASNVVTVTVVDQYGGPVRGHLVSLRSSHVPADDLESTFPVARRTDSSGSVRIGYTYEGAAASVETLQVNTAADDTATAALTVITGATEDFYWVTPAGTDGASGPVLAADVKRNTIIVGDSSDGPQLVLYDDNDQYTVDGAFTSMAVFEEALAADADEEGSPDTVVVSSYDATDAGDVARFVLTVVTS